MFSSGLALGVLYDIYRVFARLLRLSRWIIPLIDLIYWLVATVFVFRLLYYSNQGQVRIFIFLALFLGISFYFALISRWIIRLLHWLIKLAKAIYRLIRKLIHIFIVRPVIFLYRGFMVLAGFLLALSIFLGKVVLQLLYPFWFLLRPLVRWMRKAISMPVWLARIIDRVKRWFK